MSFVPEWEFDRSEKLNDCPQPTPHNRSPRRWLIQRAIAAGVLLGMLPQVLGEAEPVGESTTELAAVMAEVPAEVANAVPASDQPLTVEVTTTVVAESTTTTETTATLLPEAEVTVESAAVGLELTPEQLEAYYVTLVPGLQALADQGVISQEEASAQLAHIDGLLQNTVVSPEGYAALPIDEVNYTHVFAEHPFTATAIEPRYLMVHWAGMHYNDIFHMASSMMSRTNPDGSLNRVSAQYILDGSLLARTVPTGYTPMAAHALGANEASIGIEQNQITSMYDVTPQHVADLVYSVVYICRLMNWPINEEYVRDHASMDLIIINPDYDEASGILYGTMRKPDYPADYLRTVIIPLAQQLDAELGPRA